MEYNYLKGCGMHVSRLCLGTMTFGGQADEAASASMMDMALEAGINFVDTANIYTKTLSEQITGRLLKGRRDKVILATKACMKKSWETTDPNDMGLSRRYLYRTLEDSLRRLDTDYVDILYLHQPDRNTPMEETLMALQDLIREGKIRYYGVSNYPAWMVADMLHVAEKYNLPKPVIGEYVCNPLARGAEAELVPFMKAHNLGFTAYNPLAGGMLTGKYTAWSEKAEGNTRIATSKEYSNRYWKKEDLEASFKLAEIAQANGMTIIEMCLRWCLHHEGVESMILGASRPEQLTQNLAACQGGPLSAEVLAEIDKVWKGLSQDRFCYYR